MLRTKSVVGIALGQTLSMSREAVPNLNQCIRVGTACDKGVWPFEAAAPDSRECAIPVIARLRK
jgi:hypothetical protein